MKILFSNPPWWESDSENRLRIGIRAGSRWPFTRFANHHPDKFEFGAYLPAPFFMQYAASYTAREFPDAQIEVRDSIARGESYLAFLEHVRATVPDWVVIETATPSWDHDAKLLAIIRREFPSVQVILAGTLDAAKADEILAAHQNVAAIVQGEYDKQIAKVIRGRRGLVAHDLLSVVEMNSAPLPWFDSSAALHYVDGCPAGARAPQLQIWTSRGCPFKCCFCVWPATMTGNDPDGTKPRAVRSYSPSYVEALIGSHLAFAKASGTPYQSIYIDDDTFNLTEKHTVAICAVMRKVGLPWAAMCRADTISNETWQLMKECGCYGVKIGFESGSQDVIDRIVNKRLDLGKAAETARFIRSIGMSVHGTFTVGLPGETPAQQEETIGFIRGLYQSGGIDTHQLSGTAEIEGTPLHTLRKVGHLEKYPGATIDGNYTASADGQRKIEDMKN